jgi:hypothetical protein
MLSKTVQEHTPVRRSHHLQKNATTVVRAKTIEKHREQGPRSVMHVERQGAT